jgi:hypothetical protein
MYRRSASAIPASGGKTTPDNAKVDFTSGRRERPASSLGIGRNATSKVRPSSALNMAKLSRPSSALGVSTLSSGEKNQEDNGLLEGSWRSNKTKYKGHTYDNVRSESSQGRSRPMSAMSGMKAHRSAKDDEKDLDQEASNRPLSAMTWAQPRPASAVHQRPFHISHPSVFAYALFVPFYNGNHHHSHHTPMNIALARGLTNWFQYMSSQICSTTLFFTHELTHCLNRCALRLWRRRDLRARWQGSAALL